MVFQKNDPKTIEAAKLGGNTGKKHLQTMPKEKLKKFTTKAGKISGKSRRKKRDQALEAKKAARYQQRIMKNYLV
jgi:hypothetical protein